MLRIITIGNTEFELEDADLIVACNHCQAANQVSLGDEVEDCFECGGPIFIEYSSVLVAAKG